MANTRRNLIDAMIDYLQDSNNTIATYLDSASIIGTEYLNTTLDKQKGTALVSIPQPQTVTRQSNGNADEIYVLFVSMSFYKPSVSDTDATTGLQLILDNVYEELRADFVNNRSVLWTYFSAISGATDEILSTNFNRVELAGEEHFISADAQNLKFSFNVIVHLTRDLTA